LTTRLHTLRQRLADQQLDAFLITDQYNLRYMGGFIGSPGDACVLVTADAALLATDARYWEQARIQSPGLELVKSKGPSVTVLPDMLKRSGARRIGFEARSVTVAQHASMRESLDGELASSVEWVETQSWINQLRAVKDAQEVQLLREAVLLTDAALAAGLEQVRPGMTERELAWIMESFMRTRGAERISFDFIVAAGAHGAMAHYQPADYPISAGEPVVIDMGAQLNGYCADLTRTVCLGQPNDPDRFWAIYDTVLKAQEKAEAEMRAGMTGIEIDAIARDVISEAGYAEYFGHGLGHGVGLQVHEGPRLSFLSEDTVVAGNAVTVEPGIYITGWGGVRIEDCVVVTADGAEVLSQAPKDPIVKLG